MKKVLLYVAIIFLFANTTQAQVGIGTNNPDASAVLELQSTTKGLLMPRLTTTQVGALGSPANSLMIFNTDLNCIQINRGTAISPNFQSLIITDTENWIENNSIIYAKNAYNNSKEVGVTDNGRLFIGINFDDFKLDTKEIKLVVLKDKFEATSVLGNELLVTNSLIFDNIGDFNDNGVIEHHSNITGLNWNPTTDHKYIFANTDLFVLGDKTSSDLTSEMTNRYVSTNIMSGNKFTINLVNGINSSIYQYSDGNISTANAISSVIEIKEKGKIDNANGLFISGFFPGSNGDIQNAKAIYIRDNIKGSKSAYSIFSESRAASYFQGSIGINTLEPKSSNDIEGSLGTAITTTSSNITLDSSNHTVIITSGTPTITLPTASDCPRRIYVIVNNTGNTPGITSITNIGGGSITSLVANTSYTIQSDGTNWYVITKSN